MRGSLLECIRSLIERTYVLRTGIAELAPFVIGDDGFNRLYADDLADVTTAGRCGGVGARILVREGPDTVRACIYFPDALIDTLERFPPHRGLGEPNVEAFATFVEEIDHLLLLADRLRRGREVSLFELELQANVTKYLVLSRYLAGASGRLGAMRRQWLRYQLFLRRQYTDADPFVRERYEDAARWAWRFLAVLESMPTASRIALLRRFHRSGHGAKLELVRRGMNVSP